MLAGLGIVAFEEPAMAEFRACHAGNDEPVDHQGRAGHGVAVGVGGRLRRFHLPDFLAGLGIERDQPIVHERADDHALVDRGAPIDDAATDHAQGLRRILVRDLPDLLAGEGVDGRRRIVGGHVDNAVLDEREAFAALEVGERVGPDRNQLAHVLLVDLGERAEAVGRIPHAIDQHIARRLLVVLELVGGLGKRRKRHDRAQQGSDKHRSHH